MQRPPRSGLLETGIATAIGSRVNAVGFQSQCRLFRSNPLLLEASSR